MRKDKGLSGDLDRLPMLTWIMFLKFLDDAEKIGEADAELKEERYIPAIEFPYRWRDWAAKEDGITGNELVAFINNDETVRPDGTRGAGLFTYLRSLQGDDGGDRRDVIATVFRGTINRMINGYILRDVINKVNTINFTSSEEIHTLSHLYETLLKEMRDAAGDSGEFYTPRPVVRFIAEVINPELREKILDPAAGTGGFLVETFGHLMKQCETAEDYETLQRHSIYGGEAKPLPYLLCQMNLLLHGLEYPQMDPDNSLRFPLREIGDKERVDVIMTNPPFGGEEEPGILSNFPEDKRASETTLLFLQFIMRKLKRPLGGQRSGRCGMIVHNGTLFGGGVAARIKKELLEEFNLHTIVRLPKGVFAPYADIATNLIFFERRKPTKEIWYYELPLPEGRKQYTKTKPLKFEEFKPVIEWWHNRVENEYAWKVPVGEVIKNNYNLDIKNPNKAKAKEFSEPEKIAASIIEKEKKVFEFMREIWPQIDKGGGMQSEWSMVNLEEVLRFFREPAEIDPLATYKQITVRLHHKGVVLRGEKSGQEIQSKQYLAQTGQFIISRIDARNGAMGLIPSDLDGAVVTNDFLLYNIDETKFFPKYFDYLTTIKSFVEKCAIASEGTTNRIRLKPEKFLEIEIPLFPLDEQKRIIAIIEKVEKLKKLQVEIEKEIEQLIPSILDKAFKGDL